MMKTSSKLATLFAAGILAVTVSAQDKKPPVPTSPPERATPTPAPERDTDAKPDRTDPRSSDIPPHKEPKPAPTTDSEFVQQAAHSGGNEVKLAQLAVTKARDKGVKELAEMLVKDHTAANESLKAAAKTADIIISEKADPKADEKYARLEQMAATGFDNAFLDEMQHCHNRSIALHEAGRKVAKNQAVIAHIDKTLPVIRTHLEKITALQPGKRADTPSRDGDKKNAPLVTDPVPNRDPNRSDADRTSDPKPPQP
jgi:putative membrane protein